MEGTCQCHLGQNGGCVKIVDRCPIVCLTGGLCLNAYLSAYLNAYLSACLNACLDACLNGCCLVLVSGDPILYLVAFGCLNVGYPASDDPNVGYLPSDDPNVGYPVYDCLSACLNACCLACDQMTCLAQNVYHCACLKSTCLDQVIFRNLQTVPHR